jgi:hypothetical protein
MYRLLRYLGLLAILALPVTALAAAEGYWTYSYRNIEVTAAGDGDFARHLALYSVRLDALLSQILGITTSERPAVHIYALPAALLKKYLGSDSGSGYRITAGDVAIITDNGRVSDSDYYGAYFGYTSALLSVDHQLRGPDWYRIGLPLIFANTRYRNGHVTLGFVEAGRAQVLGRSGSLIPLSVFLAGSRSEIIAAGRSQEMYESQAWALAHEVFIERWRRPEFDRYLGMMRQGTAESAAFAASFDVTHEQLDKEFAHQILRRTSVYTMNVPADPPAGEELPRLLNAAEVQARLALLDAQFASGPGRPGPPQ